MALDFDLVQIGVVQSPVSDRRLMPPQGVPAEIHVFPEYRDGLLLIQENSHVWVLGWFEEADRGHLQVVRPTYEASRRRRGVFGLRSSARPNSLSLSAAKLIGVEDDRLRLERLDLIDGTAVVDIKRYSPSWDAIFAARSSRDRYLLDRADPALEAELEDEAVNFHGERCPAVVVGARLIQYLALNWGLMPKDDGLRVTLGIDPEIAHLVDAVQALTAATLGTGRLAVAPGREIVFQHGARRLTVDPLPLPDRDLEGLRRLAFHQLFALAED